MSVPVRCQSCGLLWPWHLIDFKPAWLRRRKGWRAWILRRLQRWLLACAADEGDDFEWQEGPCCYGPGWEPNEWAEAAAELAAMRKRGNDA